MLLVQFAAMRVFRAEPVKPAPVTMQMSSSRQEQESGSRMLDHPPCARLCGCACSVLIVLTLLTQAFSSVEGMRVTQSAPICPTIDVFSYQREGRERTVRHRIDQSHPDAARGLICGIRLFSPLDPPLV